MSSTKEVKSKKSNGNGRKLLETVVNKHKESEAFKSAMKAFEMTNRRLFPEHYKDQEKAKCG